MKYLLSSIFARSAYYVPLAHQEPASARRRPPPRAAGVRPNQQMSKKWTAWNGFKSWNTRQRGPNFGSFLGSHQIRQLTQSDPIILILYVDDKKKPKWITQRFAPPALRVLSSNDFSFPDNEHTDALIEASWVPLSSNFTRDIWDETELKETVQTLC